MNKHSLVGSPAANHLGIYKVTDRNWPTLLVRMNAIKNLLWTVDFEFTPKDARAYVGQVLGGETWSDAQFKEHARRLGLSEEERRAEDEAVDYQHVRMIPLTPHIPLDIYVEVGRRDRQERRRVSVFLNGLAVAFEDGVDSAGDVLDDGYADAISIINERRDCIAKAIPAEWFEELWNKATSRECGWPTARRADDSEEAYVYCGVVRTPGFSFCDDHHEILRLMLPRVFG